MPRPWLRPAILVCAILVAPGAASAADWFVAPAGAGQSTAGDGSRQRPFTDLWRALAVATPGDVIRVAEGVYYGRYDRSAWVIDRPRITIEGGYDRAFTRRDPWKQPSVLAFYRDYEGSNENELLYGSGDHTGIVVDGLVIDGAGRNTYDVKPPFALKHGMTMVGALVSFNSPDVVIRNSVFINSTTGAVELRGEGSRFENNIVMNHFGRPMLVLREQGGSSRRPIVVRGNTFAFAHDDTDPPMGKGGEHGVAIRVGAPAQIEKNVFAACGNAAINIFAPLSDVSIDQNVFWLTFRANIATRLDGREQIVGDKNLDELEDLGLKSSKGNRAADAGLTGLKADWMDGVSRQMLFSYATPPKDGLAALRTKYGLAEPPKPVDDYRGPVSPLLAPTDAAALRVEGDAGAHPSDLKASVAAAAAAKPVAQYTPITWAELNAASPSLEGKPIEVLVAVGNERNGFVKPGITAEQYLGFDVYGPGGDRLPDQIHVYAVRFSPAHRQWQDASKSTNWRESEDFYVLRGLGRLTGVRQAATIEVQEVVAAPAPAKPVPARPTGREWFVRAGASGGDGSKNAPYRDPFQALEKAAPGDIIRIAAGDYYGRLRSANWKVPAKFLSMIGGYDADFSARDPWKNPTRLVMSPDADKKAKSDHAGEFLECADNCEGFVLDGLIFDGSSVNAYFDAAAGGGLDLGATPAGSMVALRGANITIRNSVFANANGAAVELGSASGLFENNVVINSSGTGLRINAMGPGPWVIRRNTFLFAMDPTGRAGTGITAAGSHLILQGRAAVRIEGNVFGFADAYAIHSTVSRQKLVMDNNAFGVNLFCHFSDANRVWLFDSVWDRRLADAGLLSARGNSTTLPAGLAIDSAYADRVLPRLFDAKGRYTREEWIRFASALGSKAVPPPDAAEPVVEKPKEKPKEQSLDDLIRELDRLKADSAKPASAAAPNGPPYAPAYSWRAVIEALPASEASPVGARRVVSGSAPGGLLH